MTTPTVIDKDKPQTELAAIEGELTPPKLLDTIKQYQEDWWSVWHDMLLSTDPLERKIAIQEYNKLQLRTMPNELSVKPSESSDGSIAMGVIMLPKRFVEDTQRPDIAEEIKNDLDEQAHQSLIEM